MIQKLACYDKVESAVWPPALDQPMAQFRARWVRSISELESLSEAWSRLAEVANWPNLSYHPSFLIPAFRHLNQDGLAKLLVIDAPPLVSPSSDPVLCLVMPVIKKRFYHLPISCLEAWGNDQVFDATPLVRSDCALDAMKFAFRFLAKEKVGLLSLDTIAAESDFADTLRQVLSEGSYSSFARDEFSRAGLVPLESSEAYFEAHVSKGVQKKIRRLSKRLQERGSVTVEVSNKDSSFLQLAQEFLELEASGWKGKNGTALMSNESTRDFYLEMVSRFAADGHAKFLSLKVDGKVIAMLSDFSFHGNVSSYKTAFDEEFGRYSPGLMAELKNIEQLHQIDCVRVDSCTAPDNQMMNKIWGQRIKFQSSVIALRPGVATVAARLLPAMQATAKQVKRILANRKSD